MKSKNMIKDISIVFMCFCISVFASGCTNEKLTEEEIVEILPEEIFEIEYSDVKYEGDVTSYEIIERNTNMLTGQDDITCIITMENDFFECEKYVEICLNYKDNEWFVASYDYFDDDEMSIIIEPPVSEDQLFEQLPEEIAIVTVDDLGLLMDIESFEVIKRQTDLDNKTDTTWCKVTMTNEFYRFTKYITLVYSYYDIKGGWLLDSWSENSEKEYDVISNPLNEDDVISMLYHPSTIDSIVTACVEDMDNDVILYTIESSLSREFYTENWTETVLCAFNGTSWTFDTESGSESTEWDIVGNYYFKDAHSNCTFEMCITEFDSTNNIVYGWCVMEYDSQPTFTCYSDFYDLSEKEIEIQNNSLTIILAGTGNYVESYVTLDYPQATAEYDRWWRYEICRY